MYRVDTGGIIHLYDLTIESRNLECGIWYQATPPTMFHEWLQFAGGRKSTEGRVFVDFGSGKGRALLMASEYPFHKIVGVEFSRELVVIAESNLITYTNSRQVCHDIEIVSCDAAEYPIPEFPLVLYFNNPFGIQVMQRVIANVRRSLLKNPRAITVILYYDDNSEVDAQWLSVPGLVKTVSRPSVSVYQSAQS